jgi:hypothetical protein
LGRFGYGSTIFAGHGIKDKNALARRASLVIFRPTIALLQDSTNVIFGFRIIKHVGGHVRKLDDRLAMKSQMVGVLWRWDSSASEKYSLRMETAAKISHGVTSKTIFRHNHAVTSHLGFRGASLSREMPLSANSNQSRGCKV